MAWARTVAVGMEQCEGFYPYFRSQIAGLGNGLYVGGGGVEQKEVSRMNSYFWLEQSG